MRATLFRLGATAPILLLLTILAVPANSYVYQKNSTFNRTDRSKQRRTRTAVDSLATNPDLVLELDLDEGSGQIAADSSGNNNNGELGTTPEIDSNDPIWISPGAFDSSAALHFDASRNTVVEVQNSATLENATLTAEAFFRAPQSPGFARYLLAKGAEGCLFASFAIYTGSGGLVFYITGTNGTVIGSPGVGTSVWDGNWHHVAGVYDGKAVRFYIDGKEIGSGTATTTSINYNLSTTKNFSIGNYLGCQLPFNGDIDEVRIWRRALTPSEIALRAQGLEITTPVTITAPPDVSVSTGAGASACGAVVSDTALGTPTLSNGATFTRSGVPAGNLFPVGTTTVTYIATDGSSNTATATQTVTVVDNTVPTITAPPDVSVGTGSGASSCGKFISDATLGTPTANDNCSNFVVSRSALPTGNIFPIGDSFITYTVTDAAGNSSATATQKVTVFDNTLPVITAPANATYQCLANMPAAKASDATATDNCGIPTVTVSETNNGGAGSSTSPLIITRTYTATDAANNSATATQTITVVDNMPPVFTSVPQAVTVMTGPGAASCSVVVSDATLGMATASDNCSGSVTITRSGVPAGNLFPIGTTTITYTATDAKGNIATATQTVTVVDNTPPVKSCPANITVTAAPGSTSAIVNYPAPTATDNCSGAVTISSTPASGSSFPVGTTTVSVNATDAAGNSSSCSFTVTVLAQQTTSPIQAIQAIIDKVNALVASGVLNKGQGNSLIVKLQAAIDQIQKGNNKLAINVLQAFVNEVNALMKAGTLSSAQGQPLIDDTNAVIVQLGS